MVTSEMLSRLLQSAEENGSTTFCHSMNDYVQFNTSSGKPEYVDRDSIIALQSPEAHRFSVMNKVFNMAMEKGHTLNETCFTMLMYNLGFDINFIESSINNIKITREEDLAAFSALVNNIK
jgi:2-C-methyl-D-erythritol 4-phosphate cytidylyltransferase